MDYKIKRRVKVEVEVKPTPEEIAKAFWGMSAHEQALFLKHLWLASETAMGHYQLKTQLTALNDLLVDTRGKEVGYMGAYECSRMFSECFKD